MVEHSDSEEPGSQRPDADDIPDAPAEEWQSNLSRQQQLQSSRGVTWSSRGRALRVINPWLQLGVAVAALYLAFQADRHSRAAFEAAARDAETQQQVLMGAKSALDSSVVLAGRTLALLQLQHEQEVKLRSRRPKLRIEADLSIVSRDPASGEYVARKSHPHGTVVGFLFTNDGELRAEQPDVTVYVASDSAIIISQPDGRPPGRLASYANWPHDWVQSSLGAGVYRIRTELQLASPTVRRVRIIVTAWAGNAQTVERTFVFQFRP